MIKKLLLLSLSIISASTFAMQTNLPEESIQKIEAHIEKLQELRRVAVEAEDKKKAADITWCIERFSNAAFGRKTLGGVENASGWELGVGISSRWEI